MIIGIDIRNIGKQRTGDETVFFNLAKNLAEIDTQNEYKLFTDITDERVLENIKNSLAINNRSNFQVVSLKSPNKFCWNFRVLPLYLHKNPVDIYHTQYIVPFFVSRKIKIITHVHDLSFKAYPEFIKKSDLFFLNLLIPRSLRRADKIIAVSNFTKNELIKYYKIEAGKIEVIPNAVKDNFSKESEENLESVQKKYNLPEKFILYLGTMQPRKNIPNLIKAFAKISGQLNDFYLVLAGDKNAHNFDPQIDSVVKENKIENKVIFPGYIDEKDKPAVYKSASVFVFPSFYEGFGIPILEAMSLGTPTAASSISSHREIAGDAVAYFEPSNLDKISEIIYNIAIDENLRKKLIISGFERIKLYTWRESAQKLIDTYQGIKPKN